MDESGFSSKSKKTYKKMITIDDDSMNYLWEKLRHKSAFVNAALLEFAKNPTNRIVYFSEPEEVKNALDRISNKANG